MSHFSTLDLLPEDPIVHLPILFAADHRPNKVNLGVGTYRDSEGRLLPLACVLEAEKKLFTTSPSKEYLPILGDREFIHANAKLIFGSDFAQNNSALLTGAQTIGGTGALRIGGELLAKLPIQLIALPNPTWPNHKLTFEKSGLKTTSYRYYNPQDFRLDLDGLYEDIASFAPGTAILLHACCHNPSGIDPTKEQWQKLSDLIKAKQLIPFFDMAYQGFASGLDEDAWPVRYFAQQGHELLIGNSFSKSLGLYGERVGGFFLLSKEEETTKRIDSQVKQIIRSNYSSPPRHGMEIAKLILTDPKLYQEWSEELADMRLRLQEMRITLMSGLAVASPQKEWSFLLHQKGVFSYIGLSKEQVEKLNTEFALHMPASGRINIAGLNPHNVNYVIQAIASVLKS